MQKTATVPRFLLVVIIVAASFLAPGWGFRRTDALTLPYTSYLFSVGSIDSTRGFAYFSTSSYYEHIVRIHLSDFSYVSNLTLVNGYPSTAAVVDTLGGYAYFVSEQSNITKIRLSDFSPQGSKVLPLQGHSGCSNYGFPSAVIDSIAGFAYFGPSYSCSLQR
ncbi:hypothetical protein E6H36_07825 [Candidatus Bathyarchaeota archaeon]|nr:MAG: hypothetical protein E6H36_07825 [Candidatus Bathyarchaeota archaeon]